MEEILEFVECFVVQKGIRGRFHDQGWHCRMGMTGLMVGHELGQQLLARWVFLEQQRLQQLRKNSNLKRNPYWCRWTRLWWKSWNRPRGMTIGCSACCQEEKINCWLCDFPERPHNQWHRPLRVLSDHQMVQEGKISKRAWPHSEVAPDQID